MTCPPTALHPLVLVALTACLAVFSRPTEAHAQLRPLDPLDWTTFDTGEWSATLGAGVHVGQRASLAGTEGRLWEIGTFTVAWNTGRTTVSVGGTVVNSYVDQDVYAPPAPGTRSPDGSRRVDTGEHWVQTSVRLAGSKERGGVALRFGVRLPTTDNHTGLGRDQTDFFSTLAGRLRGGAWELSGEAGLAINGTRSLDHEQVDPLLFAARWQWTAEPVMPFVALTGQHDARAGAEVRGTENLGEGRLGVRVAGAGRWVEGAVLRGWTRMGPEFGLSVRVGMRF